MTVAEFIEWLKTQDQEATVQVVRHTSGSGYYDQGGNATLVDFDPKQFAEYTDFRGSSFIHPGDPLFDKRLLLLGAKND